MTYGERERAIKRIEGMRRAPARNYEKDHSIEECLDYYERGAARTPRECFCKHHCSCDSKRF